MSKLTHIVAAALLLFSSASCCGRKKQAAPADLSSEGFSKAMIIDFQLDGCKWMVELDNHQKLEPDKLPETFWQDSLAVWVKYEERKGAMSICMAGKPVNILDIRKR